MLMVCKIYLMVSLWKKLGCIRCKNTQLTSRVLYMLSANGSSSFVVLLVLLVPQKFLDFCDAYQEIMLVKRVEAVTETTELTQHEIFRVNETNNDHAERLGKFSKNIAQVLIFQCLLHLLVKIDAVTFEVDMANHSQDITKCTIRSFKDN